MPQLRITHGNCCAALSGGSGYAKQQPAQAPLCCFAPPHFFVCEKLLRSFLIANKKTSVTYHVI